MRKFRMSLGDLALLTPYYVRHALEIRPGIPVADGDRELGLEPDTIPRHPIQSRFGHCLLSMAKSGPNSNRSSMWDSIPEFRITLDAAVKWEHLLTVKAGLAPSKPLPYQYDHILAPVPAQSRMRDRSGNHRALL
ncbi:hypothetical protein Landi51_06393 [Colletotrichum acutatum]